jgi:hypothetical protein
LLAETFGWTYEYISSLTRPQITYIFKGMGEISKMREKELDKIKNKKSGSKYNRTPSDPDTDLDLRKGKDKNKTLNNMDLLKLVSIPGLKIDDKTKNKIETLLERNSIKEKEQNKV